MDIGHVVVASTSRDLVTSRSLGSVPRFLLSTAMATNPVPLIIDVHAHPGRCFLAGLDDSDPLAGLLGGADVVTALAAARRAGVTAVTLSTVADLRVLAPDPERGLRATRPFRPGEAQADHARQLAGLAGIVSAAGLNVARTAADVQRAHDEGRLAVLVSIATSTKPASIIRACSVLSMRARSRRPEGWSEPGHPASPAQASVTSPTRSSG